MAWILERVDNWDSMGHVQDVSVWDTKFAALQEIAFEILVSLRDMVDLSDENVLISAREIQKFIDQKDEASYQKARELFNLIVNENNYWILFEEKIKTTADNTAFITIDYDSFEDKEDQDSGMKEFVADKYGACCRTCNTQNEYAMATKEDGTYECTGCKTFSSLK